MVCIIDNYDSFTYNIVQYLYEIGISPTVFKNDKITTDRLKDLPVSHIILSPGPGKPENTGVSGAVVRDFCGSVPILGICMGHEVIASVFGAKIGYAGKVMHGKVSEIYHNETGIFRNIPRRFRATRYHSLIVENNLPEHFEVTAWTSGADGKMDEIMAIKHKTYPLQGVQFHPEAILTEYGHELFQNFLN
ncbi:MAG: aminodeoxychorismate/anthranilate synthase component II [Calditrichaceae bacterium]